MLKKFFIIFLLLISPAIVFSAQLDIKANVYEEYTLFTYKIVFSLNENYKSFSFEKPKDAKIDYAIDDLGNTIKTNIAGDYFIIEPKTDTSNRSYEIRYVSKMMSQQILSKNSFSQYINFNFPVDSLEFVFKLEDNFGEIEDYFPRTYEKLPNGAIKWDINEIKSDTLFLINFHNGSLNQINNKQNNLMYFLGWTILITILISLIFMYFIFVKKKSLIGFKFKEKNMNNDDDAKKVKSIEEKIDNNKYEEIVSKYLTDNEKEIVRVVKENQGISQYDVLNYLPSITKSNLSKIISKLNSKKILNRIRVGKINKIYLGDKLKED